MEFVDTCLDELEAISLWCVEICIQLYSDPVFGASL